MQGKHKWLDDGDCFTVLFTQAALLIIATAIAVLFLTQNNRPRRTEEKPLFSSASKRQGSDDPYAIQACPNPNCIRCRRYVEVNAAARKRLSGIIERLKQGEQQDKNNNGKYEKSSLSTETVIERVVHAVGAGPRPSEEENRTSDISPAVGQYPTVLLLRGLPSHPLVTHLHSESTEKLLDGGDNLRKSLLKEYMDCQLARHTADNTNDRVKDTGSARQADWLQNDVRGNGVWEVIHIMNQGSWNCINIKMCPRTTSLIKSLPDIMDGCIFGNAFISVLQPGTTIEPHCGPSNVRHRLHFALQIPSDLNDDDTRSHTPILDVRGITQKWKTGEFFVFDDSLTHSAVYPELPRKTSPLVARVVLVIDLWHPEVTELERSAITLLYPEV